MDAIDALLLSLESPDAGTRDRAALALMDLEETRAVPGLLRAIARPENVNHRGTLVFALSAFDPRPHLETLVALALTGNAEVSTGALSILREADRSVESLMRMRAEMDRHTVTTTTDADEMAARRCLDDLVDAN